MKRLLIVALLWPLSAFALFTNVWQGLLSATGTNWNNALNWSRAAVPTPDDVVFFTTNTVATADPTQLVSMTGSNRECNVDTAAACWEVIMTNGFSTRVRVNVGNSLTVSNSLFNNNGTVDGSTGGSTATVYGATILIGTSTGGNFTLDVPNTCNITSVTSRVLCSNLTVAAAGATVKADAGIGGAAYVTTGRLKVNGGTLMVQQGSLFVASDTGFGQLAANFGLQNPFETNSSGVVTSAAARTLHVSIGGRATQDLSQVASAVTFAVANLNFCNTAAAVANTTNSAIVLTNATFVNDGHIVLCGNTISLPGGTFIISNATLRARSISAVGSFATVIANSATLDARGSLSSTVGLRLGQSNSNRMSFTGCVLTGLVQTVAFGSLGTYTFDNSPLRVTLGGAATVGTLSSGAGNAFTFTNGSPVEITLGMDSTLSFGGAGLESLKLSSNGLPANFTSATTVNGILSNGVNLATAGNTFTAGTLTINTGGRFIASNSTVIIEGGLLAQGTGIFSNMTSTVQANVSASPAVISNVPAFYNLTSTRAGKQITLIGNAIVGGTFSSSGDSASRVSWQGAALALSNNATATFTRLDALSISNRTLTLSQSIIGSNVTGLVRRLTE